MTTSRQKFIRKLHWSIDRWVDEALKLSIGTFDIKMSFYSNFMKKKYIHNWRCPNAFHLNCINKLGNALKL